MANGIKGALRRGYMALIGGSLYVALETVWRGYSHWSMAIVGGICFLLVSELPESWGLIPDVLAGTAVITTVEFLSGVVLNLWLGWDVWDYGDMPLNVHGQICAAYSLAWAGLTVPIMLIGDFLQSRFFGKRPRRVTLLPRSARTGPSRAYKL